MLYQACLDPWAVFSIPLYLVMPFNQLIVYTCDALIISNNIFLYRFLKKQTSHNSGKSLLSILYCTVLYCTVPYCTVLL